MNNSNKLLNYFHWTNRQQKNKLPIYTVQQKRRLSSLHGRTINKFDKQKAKEEHANSECWCIVLPVCVFMARWSNFIFTRWSSDMLLNALAFCCLFVFQFVAVVLHDDFIRIFNAKLDCPREWNNESHFYSICFFSCLILCCLCSSYLIYRSHKVFVFV